MNIQPGLLCLIVAGPGTGGSCTTEREAGHAEVCEALNKAAGFTNYYKLLGDARLWKVDHDVPWSNLTGDITLNIPYEAEHNLLPIPPLNDESELFQFRQLETQS